ncbi:hypothetical protein [Bacteroides fragilis]|uniref:hypothetical protein n=1 Tax=Bacteroides fragilis TaxID=817 RepID=UPI0004B77C07|nr:hypothetical protein [Bacteroides fragilis]
MELKDFIKGTISDIAMAIKELNNEVSNTGLLVNPDNHEQDKAGNSSFIGDGRIIKDIEFNLSLSASDNRGRRRGKNQCTKGWNQQ